MTNLSRERRKSFLTLKYKRALSVKTNQVS